MTGSQKQPYCFIICKRHKWLEKKEFENFYASVSWVTSKKTGLMGEGECCLFQSQMDSFVLASSHNRSHTLHIAKFLLDCFMPHIGIHTPAVPGAKWVRKGFNGSGPWIAMREPNLSSKSGFRELKEDNPLYKRQKLPHGLPSTPTLFFLYTGF